MGSHTPAMPPTDMITLTPSGALRFECPAVPWQQRLFELGTMSDAGMDPVAAFWHALAAELVFPLCHAALPEDPSAGEAAALAQIPFSAKALMDSAPPMPGGEYLNEGALRGIWGKLVAWCVDKINLHGGIAPFLEYYAPGCRQIGRIFFHLGENKLDNARPFAFLATCATGFNEKGRLRHAPLAQAIKRYENNRGALVRLLEPLSRASENIAWVRSMCDSGEIYQARPWKPDEAYRFLLSVDELEKQGIGVLLPDWWKKRPRLQVQTEISARKDSALGVNALLDFDLQIAVGDESLDEDEINRLLAANLHGLVLVKNRWVEADSDKLRQALTHWRSVKRAAAAGQLTFHQGMRLLAGFGSADALDDAETAESIREWSLVTPGSGFRELLKNARDRELPETGSIPGLKGQLRPYQKKGVAWLRFLSSLGLGACLADDMGLGKTIQILSLLLLEKEHCDMPALLVAPASLMANWKAESARFAPGLRVLVLHPSECRQDMESFNEEKKLRQYDLVITSYAMCSRLKWLGEIEWSKVIADEAQNIKNSRTKQSVAVRRLRAAVRIALTGTPIENSVGDLWALFDFINPGLLGSAKGFDRFLKKTQKAASGLASLRRLTSPYILRRMKTDKSVISSLPDKTEVSLYCNLVREQARLYQKIVERMKESFASLKNINEDRQARNLMILQNLILLKQICNHPAQAGVTGGYAPERSGKFQRVGELCAEIASRQERVLLFTQFREIIKPLSIYLNEIFGAPGLVLHGGTPVKKRLELVNEFQREDGPPFFILSLKAGGSGLNLTSASHVIHFDRWWNPAVEDQATDRAFRIGQKKNVLVHKCLTLGTLEEKIDALIREKRDLAGKILNGIDSNITDMSDEQIMALVSLDANSIME